MKLHTVLLAHNEIQDLGEIHPNILQLLQHLDLSNNQLKEILYKKHLSKSRMLKTLDVSFNNITYVEDCAFCNTSLRTLNFAFNGMRSLNPDMVNYVSICFSCLDHLGQNHLFTILKKLISQISKHFDWVVVKLVWI